MNFFNAWYGLRTDLLNNLDSWTMLISICVILFQHRPSNLKEKLNKVKFWKRGDSGEKYEVSMHPDGESVA